MTRSAGPLNPHPPQSLVAAAFFRAALIAVLVLAITAVVYIVFSPALLVFGLLLLGAARHRRGTPAGSVARAVGALWLLVGVVAIAQISTHTVASTSSPVRVPSTSR